MDRVEGAFPIRSKRPFFKPLKGVKAQPGPETVKKLGTPKPTPKVVEKVLKQRAALNLDRREKEKVRQRDKECCRVCGRKSREVNERVMKSRGGVASIENSLVMCRICHRLFHGHAIRIVGENCNKALTFLMNAATARLIFGHKPTPKHVEIVR